MLFYVYAAVILLCFITFRSWRAVLCAVLPLMLTSILAEALMVWLGIGVKVATLPVIALGVGIGVDYALYLLSVMLGHLYAGRTLTEAYFHSLLFTGKVVMLIGLTLSLALGCAGAWIVESLNQRVWTQSELERLLQAPVLVEIPAIVSAADRRRAWKGRLAHVVLFIVFTGIYAGGLYLIYLNQTTVLRILNPLIERITS